MDVIIVCHTEFGFVHDKEVIFDKKAIAGVKKGVSNLVKVAEKYGAKVTFAVMPEAVKDFPRQIKHEVGLHTHSGWTKTNIYKGFQWDVGDSYLKERCNPSVNSTVLRDYSYKDQLDMIKTGKEHLEDSFGIEPKTFVAGRWSINNDTVKALIKSGITHDCSASAHSRSYHYDWSKLPRICMPYHPSERDYQEKGKLPLLIIPISQMLGVAHCNVNPEIVPLVGSSYLKACFLEYYKQDLPLFHICLHSPCMTDCYFISAMDDFLRFISRHKNIKFRCASEIEEHNDVNPKTKISPYLFAVNRHIIKTYSKAIKARMFGEAV